MVTGPPDVRCGFARTQRRFEGSRRVWIRSASTKTARETADRPARSQPRGFQSCRKARADRTTRTSRAPRTRRAKAMQIGRGSSSRRRERAAGRVAEPGHGRCVGWHRRPVFARSRRACCPVGTPPEEDFPRASPQVWVWETKGRGRHHICVCDGGSQEVSRAVPTPVSGQPQVAFVLAGHSSAAACPVLMGVLSNQAAAVSVLLLRAVGCARA
eukprot:91572-Rhodomonas_salina.3